MRDEQRRIAAAHPSVMEGRDIGTVVFPEAQVKIFLDADPERARPPPRRGNRGRAVDQVAREMAERDHRDRTRAEAPLTQAPDAEYLDTSAPFARAGGGSDPQAGAEANFELNIWN